MAHIKFGQMVSISERYRRRTEERQFQTWKFWESDECNLVWCVYLGTRTLQNGHRDLTDEGYIFRPMETFEAAIVCPGPRLSPILVPLDCIEIMGQ